jgi:hypothetical protein
VTTAPKTSCSVDSFLNEADERRDTHPRSHISPYRIGRNRDVSDVVFSWLGVREPRQPEGEDE